MTPKGPRRPRQPRSPKSLDRLRGANRRAMRAKVQRQNVRAKEARA